MRFDHTLSARVKLHNNRDHASCAPPLSVGFGGGDGRTAREVFDQVRLYRHRQDPQQRPSGYPVRQVSS